jgi:hypothetical protein
MNVLTSTSFGISSIFESTVSVAIVLTEGNKNPFNNGITIRDHRYNGT